jgi:hypothetical protein
MAKAPRQPRAGRSRPAEEENDDDGELETLDDDKAPEGDEGDEGEGDEEEEGEGDEEEQEISYVAFHRDPTIWIAYLDMRAVLPSLNLSPGAIWRMDDLGNIELCDAGRDGLAQPVSERLNFVGTLERFVTGVGPETAEQAQMRAQLELAERFKACWDGTEQQRQELLAGKPPAPGR